MTLYVCMLCDSAYGTIYVVLFLLLLLYLKSKLEESSKHCAELSKIQSVFSILYYVTQW